MELGRRIINGRIFVVQAVYTKKTPATKRQKNLERKYYTRLIKEGMRYKVLRGSLK